MEELTEQNKTAQNSELYIKKKKIQHGIKVASKPMGKENIL